MRSTLKISTASDGLHGPRLIDTGRGLTVFYNDRFLYSRIDPRKRPENIIRSLRLKDETLIIIPGPLLGYGLELLSASLKPGDHVLCLEIDQALMALSLEHIDSGILNDDRFTFIRTESPYQAVLYLLRKNLLGVRRTEYVPLSGSTALNADAYGRFHDAIDHAVKRYWENRMTLVHMGRLWIKNIFLNLGSCGGMGSASLLKIDKPVVVAGAGESLETSFSWIGEIRESIYLISVDTALKSFLSAGITPDLVIALDAQHANLRDFIGTGDARFDLAADITAFPEIIRRINGKIFLFSSEFSQVRLLERLRERGLLPLVIPPLGSVGLAALFLALTLTDGLVLLTGLDFSYTPGKPHAKGSPTHQVHLSQSWRLKPSPLYHVSDVRPFLKVPGKGGGSVLTDFVLSSYGQDARDILAGYTGRIVDAGPVGLPLGITPVTDRDRIIALIRNAGKPARISESRQADRDIGWRNDERDSERVGIDAGKNRDDAHQFLLEEEKLLSRLIDEGRRMLSDPDDGRAMEFGTRMKELLDELDYVYIDFPDAAGSPTATRPFLARTLASARYYRNYVENALSSRENIRP